MYSFDGGLRLCMKIYMGKVYVIQCNWWNIFYWNVLLIQINNPTRCQKHSCQTLLSCCQICCHAIKYAVMPPNMLSCHQISYCCLTMGVCFVHGRGCKVELIPAALWIMPACGRGLNLAYRAPMYANCMHSWILLKQVYSLLQGIIDCHLVIVRWMPSILLKDWTSPLLQTCSIICLW